MNNSLFFYHAHGIALGGTITGPVGMQQQIEAQGGASLPITGGIGSSRVGRFKVEGIVSFESAHTEVSGNKNSDGSYSTEVTTTVEGLNILGTVKADTVVAHVLTRHPADGGEPTIVAEGSTFVNLSVGGHAAQVELDLPLFSDLNTYQGFKQRYETNADFKAMARKRFLWGDLDNDVPQWLQERYKWHRQQPGLPVSKGIVQCSLVKKITCACPGLKCYGHILLHPDVGKIHLAEIIMASQSRRVTMMRLELGSPVDGTITVGSGEGNGSHYP